MTEVDRKDLPDQKAPPSLAVAFWRWLVLGMILVVAAVFTNAFGLSTLLSDSVRGYFDLAILTFACIVYPVGAIGVVWRAGRQSHSTIRWISRLAAIFIWIVSILVSMGYVMSIDRHHYEISGKLFEGVNLSNPHRSAIEIACSEKTLRAGMSADELELEEPSKYEGSLTRSVAAEVESKSNAKVVITVKAISNVIREGDTVVYSGTCGPDGITWEIGGTVPKKFRPRN